MSETNAVVAVYPNHASVGGVRALGAGLYSMGIPKDSILKYELALKANNFVLVANGTAGEVARVKDILQTTQPSSLALHPAAPVKKAATV